VQVHAPACDQNAIRSAAIKLTNRVGTSSAPTGKSW
jgi:hypothetical protein